MKVVVASQNPVKVNAVLNSFRRYYDAEVEVVGISVPSGVSDQPMSEEETRQGAVNRANRASELEPGTDFYVGIEGGVDRVGDRLFAFAWIAISNTDFDSLARTATFELPPEVSQLIFEGMELGDADDQVFKKNNSKQQNGAVGLLTQDLVTREKLYEQAVLLALIPYMNRELYPASKVSVH